jgi:hypothetical protein
MSITIKTDNLREEIAPLYNETPSRDRYLAALAAFEAADAAYMDAAHDPNDMAERDAAEAELTEARNAYRDSDEPRTWSYSGDGGEGHSDTFERRPDLQALAEEGDWSDALEHEGCSIAVRVHATCEETEEELSALCQIDPEEPDCLDGCDHDWHSGQVYGRTAGITSTDHCVLCGLSRTGYTCSQGSNAETEHDHDGVRYHDDDWSQTEIAKHHGDDVPGAIVEAAKLEWESGAVARCYGPDGDQPGTCEVSIESATLGDIEIYRWHESESGDSGPARWTRERAVADAEEHASDRDETPDLDETIDAIVDTGIFSCDSDDVREICEAAVHHSEGYLLLATGQRLPSPAGIAWTTDGYLQCDRVQMPCGQESAELAAAVLLSICRSERDGDGEAR